MGTRPLSKTFESSFSTATKLWSSALMLEDFTVLCHVRKQEKSSPPLDISQRINYTITLVHIQCKTFRLEAVAYTYHASSAESALRDTYM